MLGYFQGRIGEDDLLALLKKRAQQAEGVGAGANEGPPADLQNYLIREFVESLYGLKDTLKTALYWPHALESALLGQFTPAALAERVLTALLSGRRSATAAALEFAELVRVVVGLPTESSDADQTAIKVWLVRRIAWRLQALAEGDLSDRARRRAGELACDADLRMNPPPMKAAT